MFQRTFAAQNGTHSRPQPAIIPSSSHENLSSKQLVLQHQQHFQERRSHHIPPFFPRSPAAAPMTAMAVSAPQMMSLTASDDELLRMEQEVEASHLAARLTLARMRAARAVQISRQDQELQFQQRQQFQQRHAAMTQLNYRLQQSQCSGPRIVSPVKQARPLHPRQLKTKDAPSLPGLDLLHTASLSLASEVTSNQPSTPQLSFRHSPGLSPTKDADAVTNPFMPVLESNCSFGNVETNSQSSLSSSSSVHDEHLASGAERTYINQVRPTDILCGRGGRSNHHPGNKQYRQTVGNIKFAYQQCPAKTLKTDLSRAIVENCYGYGARFIKQDASNGRYYVLTKAEARKKTSQALRETKALKWTR